MTTTRICKDIFKAIHQGKWLDIKYKNKSDNITHYWIGVKNIQIETRMLVVDGLRLGQLALTELIIRLDAIQSSSVLDGTYCEINQALCDDISESPEKYKDLFGDIANLKILDYYEECNKLDATPYSCEYELVNYLDRDNVPSSDIPLSDEQFTKIVNCFSVEKKQKGGPLELKQLGMNVMGIHTHKGLYLLAYRRLFVDVKEQSLHAEKEITICKEFDIGGEKLSIGQFLDADDLRLLEDFEKNQEKIKDRIARNSPDTGGVDDMPYFVAVGVNILADLQYEYRAILDKYASANVTDPISAFFGELLSRPKRRKEYPIALLDDKVNLDQLLAISNAMKYPLTYVQGPPGTGKTSTIINTMLTAFFDERTVLFASYNNHPVDGVHGTLRNMQYRGRPIAFPVLRLGNRRKVEEALKDLKSLYDYAGKLNIDDYTLERVRDAKLKRSAELTELLKRHQEILNWKERREAIETLLRSGSHFGFRMRLQEQLNAVDQKLSELGSVSNEQALALVAKDTEGFREYLYYTSIKFVKRLDEPRNKELLKILEITDPIEQVKAFNLYTRDEDNLKKLLRVFPIILTSCVSANKLFGREPVFDMVIIDEASQCNTAIALLPVMRGESLMLVGDPQQLNPVVLLTEANNRILRQRFKVADEYDYIRNSVYKTFLACDSVSDEVLLSYHYRCHPKIIQFNNKKYYNNRLNVRSSAKSDRPLIFAETNDSKPDQRNTAPLEAERVVELVKRNRDKKIGIITPFVNQKQMIQHMLRENNIADVPCGTVHAFQGDEKDIILFSLALTSKTSNSTYKWLKSNRELINVAVSRAKEQLVLVANSEQLNRLHAGQAEDDLYELAQYVKRNGESTVTQKKAASRALGIKAYSTETEAAFLENINHAIENIMPEGIKYEVKKEVAIATVFSQNLSGIDLFYSGRFDFVVYERRGQMPVLAIELDGKEHFESEIVKARDLKKREICQTHGFELIRIENSYARRYQYIKDILISFFKRA
jgi:hypothetical protein